METKAFEDFDSMDTQQEEQAKKEKKASAAKVAGIAGAAGIAGGATAFGAEAAIDMINNNIDIEDEIIEEAPTQASPSRPQRTPETLVQEETVQQEITPEVQETVVAADIVAGELVDNEGNPLPLVEEGQTTVAIEEPEIVEIIMPQSEVAEADIEDILLEPEIESSDDMIIGEELADIGLGGLDDNMEDLAEDIILNDFEPIV